MSIHIRVISGEVAELKFFGWTENAGRPRLDPETKHVSGNFRQMATDK